MVLGKNGVAGSSCEKLMDQRAFSPLGSHGSVQIPTRGPLHWTNYSLSLGQALKLVTRYATSEYGLQ
jgi:hypothetical protein